MSLRARLVLVLGSLVALLLAAEWSLVRALTRDLDQEVDVVALTVGSSVLSLFAPADGEHGPPELHAVRRAPWLVRGEAVHGAARALPAAPGEDTWVERRVVIHGEGPHLDTSHEGGRAGVERSFELRHKSPTDRARGTDDSLTFEGAFEGDLEVVVLRAEPHERMELERTELVHTGPTTEGRRLEPGEEQDTLQRDDAGTQQHREARVALRVGSHTMAVPLDIEGLPWPTGTWASAAWSSRPDVTLHADVTASPAPPALHPAGRTFVRTFERTGGPGTTSALRIPVPRGGLDRAVEAFLSKLLLGSIALFALGLGAIAWVAHRVTRPLRNLADAAERVGRGQLGTVVDETGDRDVTKTLRAFNDMSLRLAALDEEAQRLRDREHLGELGDVARGLAHALRNPLHTLGLAVDALGNGRDDTRDTVRAARTQIQRIDGALEGFLTLAGAGGIREEVALDDLARDVALELAQSTQPCAVRVLAEGGAVRIECVPAELRAVVHALVVNAAEAAPGEPVVVRVEHSERVGGGALARLEVLDRGPGLALEVRNRLFTPHVTTKAHGTGMGLYLAERIARTRYGGSLALHERPGGGVRAVLEVTLDGVGVSSDTGDREPRGDRV